MQFWPNTTRTDTIVLSHYIACFSRYYLLAVLLALPVENVLIQLSSLSSNSIDKFENEITYFRG